MRCLRPSILLVLVIGAQACSPVARPTSPQGSSVTTDINPASRPRGSELASDQSPATSSTYDVLAVVGQETGTVNLRAGPGTDFLVVARLTVGEAAPVVGRTAQSDWWKLDLDGTTAWVFASLVNIVGNPAGVPIVPTQTLPPP